MKKTIAGLLLCTSLVACGGEPPFPVEETETDEAVVGGDEAIAGDRTVPPGTASPTSNNNIFRKEPTSSDESSNGNGFATNVTYNATDDTFSVDNLPFDGSDDAPYVRGTAVSSLGQYAVYEAVSQYPDSLTGEPVNQFTHRAIYGVSASGNTKFAIVRTGAYTQYGFGGFVYERTGGVTLPTEGQAIYSGSAAGIRDRNGSGGLEYSTADVRVGVDFSDFDEETGRYPGAVGGTIRNRRVFDVAGNDITSAVVARINEENSASLTAVPVVTFTIAPNALDGNGEALGKITSRFVNDAGDPTSYETGNYYAVVSGDNANEIVGIVVAENTSDPVADSVRDTMGFVVYRQP